MGPAHVGCSVEVPVRALYKGAVGSSPLIPLKLAKVVKVCARETIASRLPAPEFLNYWAIAAADIKTGDCTN